MGAIFRVESYRNAFTILELPTTITRDHAKFDFKVSWVWAIDANTKSMQPRTFESPTKDNNKPPSSEDMTRITALQNQIKLTQKMEVKEVKHLKHKMNSENNKNRLAMITFITKNNWAINKSIKANYKCQIQI